MSAIVIKVPNRGIRYVAIKPGKGHVVVACGKDWTDARKKARKAGHPNAALMWVPDPRKRYVF